MPRFNEHDFLDFDIDVNISVNDFLSECNSNDINDVINWLKCNGELKDNETYQANSISQEMFYEQLDKIYNNYYQLTNEEQTLIEKIAKRF
jgi:hypothetical protein